MPAADPLSLLYSELWSIAESHPDFDAKVKAGNRVKFDADHPSDARPLRKIQSADLPELMLTYEGFKGPLRSSTSSTTFDVRWSWVLTTGDMRIDEVLLPLSWMLTESMVRWHSELTALEWYGTKFVKKVDLTDARAGESEILRVSNIRGWSTVLMIQTTLVLPSAAMVAAATPPTP